MVHPAFMNTTLETELYCISLYMMRLKLYYQEMDYFLGFGSTSLVFLAV